MHLEVVTAQILQAHHYMAQLETWVHLKLYMSERNAKAD